MTLGGRILTELSMITPISESYLTRKPETESKAQTKKHKILTRRGRKKYNILERQGRGETIRGQNKGSSYSKLKN
jgi:hypothetical protein